MIQIAQPDVDIPVVQVPVPTDGGTSVISYLAYPEYHKHQSALKLILDSETFAKLQPHQPLEIKTEPTGLRGYFDGNGELVVLSESEWQHFDKQKHDDEEILILSAAQLFWGGD